MEYVADFETLVFCTREGAIIQVPTSNTGSREVVGVLDSGILCMCWSPDNELFVIATGNSTLVAMSSDFDIITEVPAAPTEEKEKVGKIESIKMSWRGDAKFFVTNSIEEGGESVMRVWERSCSLSATSRGNKGMSGNVCWMPSGSIIASSQLTHVHQIIFFEKNGLRHYEFDLREKEPVQVLDIQWNSGSDVLALLLKSKERRYVQLWTRGNYHWYLKQQLLNEGCQEDKVVQMSWDPENAMVLRLLFENGSFTQFHFSFDVTVPHSLTQQNPSTVAVVDGSEWKHFFCFNILGNVFF